MRELIYLKCGKLNQIYPLIKQIKWGNFRNNLAVNLVFIR